ncbi:MAG: pyridoxamine 5'-phosphate oxidase family protein [Alphaproteobacteria bacterium]|nr:pyridoxamine 5'-phosphate oxidase family protein [Alphaproteobacteria bacterium]
MLKSTRETDHGSPFHAGEQKLQDLAGKREAIESFGRRAFRPFMPDQHREFFSQLPFVVVGAVDAQGWPWASLLPGRPGFMQSPDSKTLTIAAAVAPGDPVGKAIMPGAALGLLGIEMHTRRRNRLNGRVTGKDDGGFTVTVDQSFGNCPQYIQHRDVTFVRAPGEPGRSGRADPLVELDNRARSLIAGSDAFFVSSYIPARDDPAIEGVDVSHRGGRPGFVRVDGNVLTIPDFAGNNIFNTLGNFLMNAKAGLVFVDFAKGDLLSLTGTVEILPDDHDDVVGFQGALRAWRFTLDHGVWLEDALPFRSTLGDYSPNTLLTDTWADAAARTAAEARRQTWRRFRIDRVEDESAGIRSFYLVPDDGDPLLPFRAGQFLSVRVTLEGKPTVRTYTVSSAPADPFYRISVKREVRGTVSLHLHDWLSTGDRIDIKAPSGAFHIDPAETRPAVLIAGGIGITPMVSMARHVAMEGLRTKHLRRLTVIHAAKTTRQRAFAETFRELEQGTSGQIRYISLVSNPSPDEQPGDAFNGAGRISAKALQQILPLDDYDFFLCGPPSFMQSLYDMLRDLGVRDVRIFTEAFGPASLDRRLDVAAPHPAGGEEADGAVVRFGRSDFEQQWESGGPTVLELAETHGLSPAFSCRGGSCGTCATKRISGRVAYRTTPTADHADDEVLICCAVPAKGCKSLEIDL